MERNISFSLFLLHMVGFPLPWKLTDTQLARPGVAAMLGSLLLEKRTLVVNKIPCPEY
jgi:hypothetical protein